MIGKTTPGGPQGIQNREEIDQKSDLFWKFFLRAPQDLPRTPQDCPRRPEELENDPRKLQNWLPGDPRGTQHEYPRDAAWRNARSD